MKDMLILIFILLIGACSSTQKVAEYRNHDFSSSNNFEEFRFWRELDIDRFKNNILNVKIGIIPENMALRDLTNASYMKAEMDSITTKIKDRNEAFIQFRQEYLDTSDTGKAGIYYKLKTDSADLVFLEDIDDDPYYELYAHIISRTTLALKKCNFYSTRENFEDYIEKRSFTTSTIDELLNIFDGGILTVDKMDKLHLQKLKAEHINFLIFYSKQYGASYSDQAGERVGSENILLKLYSVMGNRIIASAEMTYFWGNEFQDSELSLDNP
jgi:hypothetical protein